MTSRQAGRGQANSGKTGLALYIERIQQGREAPWTKEELLTCVHWQKQLTAFIIGILLGVIPLTGLEGFATFLVLQLASTVVFYRMILRVDEEVHGSVGEALMDGLPTFTALFVLLWVLTYNMVHIK